MRLWREAQQRAGIRRPIPFHGLRHQFVSLLIAAGKHPKYISAQAGHATAGFTLDRYGHLFDSIAPTPVEWPEDLLWPDSIPEWVEAACRWQPGGNLVAKRLENDGDDGGQVAWDEEVHSAANPTSGVVFEDFRGLEKTPGD